jgi:CysZ protein
MLKELIISIQAYFEAHQFIKKHRLWKWIIVPGLIYSILFIIGIYYFWTSSNAATSWMLTKFGAKKWLDQMQDSWLSFFFLVGQVFIHLLLLIFYFSLFKFIFLIIGSPVFAYLSEKTQSIIDGKTFPFSIKQLGIDIVRGIRVAIRNMAWQTVYMIALFIIALFPIVGWVTPLFLLFIDCYYTGFSMLDYYNERNQINAAKSVDIINHHRGLAIGNGMIFYILHAIPFIGWVFAPSYAVIAATLSMHKAKEINLIQ